MTGKSRNAGFTVVELIVALSISAVTLLSGYELFQALKDVGDNQSAELAARARILHGLDRIREDLWHAVPRSGLAAPIFVGVNRDPEAPAESTTLLEFYTLCPGCGGSRFQSVRQIHQVSYELVQGKDSTRLYRKAAPIIRAGPMPGDEQRELILEDVTEVALAFHNGQTLETDFSSENKLPPTVELTVHVREQVWPLSVRLPCGTLEEQP
jgi:prepilin-type N-terminal cleavage/methylation domain-containing protein